jgi:hypothetical protein
MSITTHEVTGWKSDLEDMINEVTDESARASLNHLRSALEPYFETPELFRAILGKIQMVTVNAETEAEITSRAFANLDELKATLPEGLTVTTL